MYDILLLVKLGLNDGKTAPKTLKVRDFILEI